MCNKFYFNSHLPQSVRYFLKKPENHLAVILLAQYFSDRCLSQVIPIVFLIDIFGHQISLSIDFHTEKH